MPASPRVPSRRFAVYLKGRKVRSFVMPVTWPFIWNVGCIIGVRGHKARVLSIRERSSSWYARDGVMGLTRVFVSRAI